MKKGFVLLFCLVLFNCQSFDAASPESGIRLVSVDITEIGFSGANLLVNLAVHNPGRGAILMPDIEWELFIDGHSFLRGIHSEAAPIARRQTASLSVPVSITFQDIYASFADLAGSSEVAYSLSISIPSVSGAENEKHTLEFSCLLALPLLPELSLDSKRISNFDFSEIHLSHDVIVHNPNAFAIAFPMLDWHYSVNGISIVGSNFTVQQEIAAGASGRVPLGISVPYAEISDVVSATQATGNFSVALNLADMGFPPAALPSAYANIAASMSASIPVLTKPELSFRGIARRSLGHMRLEFEISWEVDNRNGFAFEISGFNHEFMVNNTLWARGSVDTPTRIAANGRTVVSKNVVITTPALVHELVSILSRGADIAYNNLGSISLLPDHPDLERLELPLNFTGNTRIR